ncbi:MAG TPA: FAD-dependent oxidoreductase, partial [Candidatus Latescibacteria bacterium]|nr:FAD-dependent oxidoreductase [Candidatus Latescibacterota bacterium]
LCRFVPGFEEAYLLDTSNQIGVRSSRRLRGLATVSDEDVWNFNKYPDSIARASWDVDVWPADSYSKAAVPLGTDGYKWRQERMERGDYFDIPYGAIVADGVDNLFMAGRCISASHLAQASLRIQQTCMSTGQAAGTAAALCVRTGASPRALDPQRVIRQLEQDRAAVKPALDVSQL